MNLVPLLYVGFRIIPFIMVCFFVLSAIIKSDIRGVSFLGLLLINCGVVSMTDSIMSDYIKPIRTPEQNGICDTLTIGTDGSRLSRIPFNINIVSFTFAYLVYLIAKNEQVYANVHSIVFFTVLLAAMSGWELMNNCSNGVGILFAIVIGGGLGVGFCEMMIQLGKKYNIPGVHFFTNVTNDEVCKMTNEEIFECSTTN
jgi:hypothetical protein